MFGPYSSISEKFSSISEVNITFEHKREMVILYSSSINSVFIDQLEVKVHTTMATLPSFHLFNDQNVTTIGATNSLRVPYGNITLPHGPPLPIAGSVMVRKEDNSLYYADGAIWQSTSSSSGPVVISDTTPSISCDTGALTVEGGVGIEGDIWVCGAGHFGSTGSVDPLAPVLAVSSGGSDSTTTTLLGSQTVNRVLTLPDVTDTLVGKTTSDVLTNKTIINMSDNVTASALFSAARTNTVSVFAAANPTAGQVLTATDANTATWQAPPSASALGFAFFYGLTAGTGNGGPTDYAATVAVKTSAGTGRVPFPRVGPAAAGILAIDSSSFTLPVVGTYEITFKVHTTEPGQLQLEVQGTALPETTTPNMNPTSGGHLIVGNSIITTSVINSVLAVINPTGNSAALTITPANGSQTWANAQSISIKRLV